MEKVDWDQLYHLLRKAFNSEDSRERAAARGITKHLFGPLGGDYESLLAFSTYYGTKFLLGPTCATVKTAGLKFGRVVEFGAGKSWLCDGLGKCFGVPILPIDKRKWFLGSMMADLETEQGKADVLRELRRDDLIVMCDFLHCLDVPGMVMAPFAHWDIVILEYMPKSAEYRRSFANQLKHFAVPSLASRDDLDRMFTFRRRTKYDLDPYLLMVVRKADYP